MMRESKEARELGGKEHESKNAADPSRPRPGESDMESAGQDRGGEGPPGRAENDDMIRLDAGDVAEVINKKDEELVKKNEEIEALKDVLKRRQADFENYKKRLAKSQEEYRNLAIRDMSMDIIANNDDLLHAVDAAGAVSDNCTVAEARTAFLDGVLMISRQVEEMLRKYGIEEIESIDREFDPALNEAVEIDESPDVERDTITKVYRKGFRMGDTVVRAAKVRVSRPARVSEQGGCEGSVPGDGDRADGAQC